MPLQVIDDLGLVIGNYGTMSGMGWADGDGNFSRHSQPCEQDGGGPVLVLAGAATADTGEEGDLGAGDCQP